MYAGALSSSTILAEVRRIVRSNLSSLTTQIDLEGFYPECTAARGHGACALRRRGAAPPAAGPFHRFRGHAHLLPALRRRLCATTARRSAYDLSTLKQPCCTQDEGRPLAAALQEEAANHLTLRGSRARVVSGKETA